MMRPYFLRVSTTLGLEKLSISRLGAIHQFVAFDLIRILA